MSHKTEGPMSVFMPWNQNLDSLFSGYLMNLAQGLSCIHDVVHKRHPQRFQLLDNESKNRLSVAI